MNRTAAKKLRGTPSSLGERVRRLRNQAGLTQSELAGSRFSKEYVSQIERGKTRPTRDTIDWLASRLGVDPGMLTDGVSSEERGRTEAALFRAEALSEDGRHEAALAELEPLGSTLTASGSDDLRVRALRAEARARVLLGKVREGMGLLEQARDLTEGPGFSDLDRAEVLFRLGVCRYKLSSISTAIALLDQALELAERSGYPSDTLRSNILRWRSSCYRRQRDYEAAREDVERALELAEALDDRRTTAHLLFQASLIAERDGHWVAARGYAERARLLYEEISDRTNVGRLLNNLGGLSFLLGKPERAVDYLKRAFTVALEVGSDGDAAQAVSSLAQVHLRTGEVELAEDQARQALSLIEGRDDFADELGNVQLVLGRSLLEQGRLDEAEVVFDAAERTVERLSSASHRAAAAVARGDLATARGHDRDAARLYRHAAELLQDVRF